jgi:hypothetical protein
MYGLKLPTPHPQTSQARAMLKTINAKAAKIPFITTFLVVIFFLHKYIFMEVLKKRVFLMVLYDFYQVY